MKGRSTPYVCLLSLIARTLLMSSDVQASMFSEFARVQSGFNHFRTAIHDLSAHIAAIFAIDIEGYSGAIRGKQESSTRLAQQEEGGFW
jgi:hypothetical protein